MASALRVSSVLIGQRQLLATHLPENTGWSGERSGDGCDLARPVVPEGTGLFKLLGLVSTRSRVVTNAATIAIITATAKSAKAVR
jgi:hypothetical protein